MLHSRLTVELPSEPLPRSGPIMRLLVALFTDGEPKGDRDRLLADSLEILRASLTAFHAADFDDVVAIRVGGSTIYADTEQRLDDLEDALRRVVESGRLAPGFRSVRVVLSHRAEGLHTVAELVLDEEVARGTAPLSVALTGRIEGLRVRPDESLLEYRARVDAALADGELERCRAELDRSTRALSDALSEAFGSAAVRIEPTAVRVVAPGPLQVARFRHLGVGRRLRSPTYRPDPKAHTRSAAYDHAHVRYFFDPYHDLLCWIIVDAVLEGRAAATRMTIVDPDANVLLQLDGSTARPASVELPVARELVTLEESSVAVDESIRAAGMDAAESGNPHTPGYGGEGYG